MVLEKLLELATQRGVEAAELYYEESDNLKIGAFQGVIETYTRSETRGLGIRVLKDGGVGLAYTENLGMAEQALDEAIANAEFVPAPPEVGIHAFDGDLPVVTLYNESLGEVPAADKISLAIALENLTLAADSRVDRVPYAQYGESARTVRILNSAGVDRSYRSNVASVMIEAMVKADDDVKEQWEMEASRDFSKLDAQALATKAATLAVKKLNSRELVSGHYPVVLNADVVAQLFDVYSDLFSAKLAQEGKSLLRDRLDQVIASPLLTIVDDPLHAEGFSTRPFDDEGCPSKPLTLVDQGRFIHFMHNSETAKKAGVVSTGHAKRGGYKGALTVSPSNLIVQAGSTPNDELVKSLEKGVIITSLAGLHAGANLLSGDFSLQGEGIFVENGAEAYPVHLFTVSGNILELFQNVVAVGDRVEFFPYSHTATPPLLIREVACAGA